MNQAGKVLCAACAREALDVAAQRVRVKRAWGEDVDGRVVGGWLGRRRTAACVRRAAGEVVCRSERARHPRSPRSTTVTLSPLRASQRLAFEDGRLPAVNVAESADFSLATGADFWMAIDSRTRTVPQKAEFGRIRSPISGFVDHPNRGGLWVAPACGTRAWHATSNSPIRRSRRADA